LSLRNQYDTKTPRASLFCLGRQMDGAFLRAVRRPSPEKAGPARVTKKIYSVGFEMSVENFFRKRNRKISQELPKHCRTAATSMQQGQSKRSTWSRGPQAVLKYSCLGNTLRKIGQEGQDSLRTPCQRIQREGRPFRISLPTRQMGLRRRSELRSLAGTGKAHRRRCPRSREACSPAAARVIVL
jgi:hypothetical protein